MSKSVIQYKIEWITIGYHKVHTLHSCTLLEICIVANEIVNLTMEEFVLCFINLVLEDIIDDICFDDSDSI